MTGAVGAAACALGAALIIGMGSPAAPPQAFDAVFHLAAVGAVREGGSASSLGGLSALYQGARVYYPSVWHGVVALLPGGPVEASNAMILAVGAVAWPLGVAGLLTEALRAAPRRRADEPDPGAESGADRDARAAHRARERAVALGVLLSAATVGAPAVLLTSLAAWPYALSVVALPGALALAVRARRAVAQRRARADATALAALAVLGVALAHGTGLFNVAVLLLPVAVGDAAGALRRGGRARLVALGAIGALALAAGAGARAMRGPLASLFNYERAGGSAAGTLVQALIDLPQYGPLASHGPPVGVVLLAPAVLGLRGARDARVRPWAAAALAALVLVVLVGGPQWPGRQVGSPWYLQKSRIEPLLLIPMLVLAAHGAVALLSRLDGAGRPGLLRRPAAALAALALVAVAGRIPLQIELARSVYDAERIAFGTLTTPRELAFYASVGDVLPAGAVVVGSPSRGVTYLGLVADVELVYPTRVEPAGGAELALTRADPDPRPGSATCDLVKRLGVQYYVSVERSPGGLRHGNAPLYWDGRIAAWPTRGMELVSRADTGRGAVALWRITACG